MADQNKKSSIQERIRQALKNLGAAIEDLVPKPQLQPQPIPVNRPQRKRINPRNFK